MDELSQQREVQIEAEMFARVCKELYPQQFVHVLSECKAMILQERLDDALGKLSAEDEKSS